MFTRAVILAALVACSLSDTVTWTGEGTNNLWDNYANWDPAGIPNSGQDCVINTPGTILIGTANGAQCQSLQIGTGVTLNILGSSATFGSLQVTGNSVVNVNAGAGSLTVTRAAFVNQSLLTWSSGSIAGNYEIGAQVRVTVNTNRGFVQCTSGTWYNKGSIYILGGSQVSSCAIVNSGVLNLESDSAANPTTLLSIPVDPKSTGKVSITGLVEVKSATLNNVLVQGTLSVIANGNAVFSSIQVQSTATVKSGLVIAEPSTTLIQGLSCSGTFAVMGASAKVNVVGSTSINTVQLTLGTLTFQNYALLNQVMTSQGVLTFVGNATIGDFSSDATVLAGSGSVSVNNAQITSPSQVQTTLLVQRKLAINSRQLTLDGHITIGPQAVLTIAGSSAHWGPTSAERRGSLTNNGVLVIGYPNVTMNSIIYSGSGSLWVVDATADFQVMNVTTPIAGLNTSSSVIKGEEFVFGYGALLGPRQGSTIGLLFDQNYNTCQSPCSNQSPRRAAQTYWARVSRA